MTQEEQILSTIDLGQHEKEDHSQNEADEEELEMVTVQTQFFSNLKKRKKRSRTSEHLDT